MKRIFLVLFIGLSTAAAVAQTIVSIGDQAISKEEFEYYYQKNNHNQIQSISPADYMQMFIDFKLKVTEAYAQKYDTVQAFKNELEGYRKQLVGPYLTDTVKRNELVQEAYQRMLEDIEVSHILFSVDFPSQAPEALAKAEKARKKLKKSNFAQKAVELSEDPSVQYNQGYLGYATGGAYVYPFEEAAYKLKKGKISEPIRTAFGYHLILLHNKRPSNGEVRVAHIFKQKPQYADSAQLASIKASVYDIYQQLQNGANFAEMARQHSEDNNAEKGGEMPWLKLGDTNPYFEETAFALNAENRLSEPVEAPYGWHIIYLLEKRPIASFEYHKAQLESRVMQDERRRIIRDSFIEKLKKEYHFTTGKDSIIATFANQVLTQSELNQFCATQPHSADSVADFINYRLLTYENTQLESKYPEFGMLMSEYRDGILLFNICNDLIWSKASKDTEGLKAYFEANKANYPEGYTYNKGPVVNDYQTYLEKQWLASLHQKYPVIVHTEVLNTVQ
jgi:peptidyl-prolyl cis-trans isomerase SurA